MKGYLQYPHPIGFSSHDNQAPTPADKITHALATCPHLACSQLPVYQLHLPSLWLVLEGGAQLLQVHKSPSPEVRKLLP